MLKFLHKIFFLVLLSCISFPQTSNLTLLCIAAHPDDEDGATLAYYSKIKGYKAYTIFYTRGEGGQNEIGPELYDELGRIREQECYNAAAIQGSTAYFLGFLDFGYSKTAKETLKVWGGRDSVLQRIVYMIRVIRPDVVISNHDTITTKPNRQHGHHQAAGITIYDAFDKAADPDYHPEQLKDGITPWQVKKLFFRQNDTSVSSSVEIDVSIKDFTGKTIKDIARDALSKHRTQGMDTPEWQDSYWASGNRFYELVRSDNTYPFERSDLFSGLLANEKFNYPGLTSYAAQYSYNRINPQDSLKLLNELEFYKDAYIGIVNTYDNTLENILKAFKIKYDILDSLNFIKNDFKKYTCILLDIRTYLYRPDVAGNNEKILKYAENGGNVVCFYNKPVEWNGRNFSPFPITLTAERVTEENAGVVILDSLNSLFYNFNKITEKDWDGWVQERNIYLPADDTALTAVNYWRLLRMNDEDDPVPSTSLLYALYGSGHYTYCSLALYRQLKIFNEGALKLFLNMISQPYVLLKIKE